MIIPPHSSIADFSSVIYRRCIVNLSSGAIDFEDVPCDNLESVLGGFARSFQILAQRDISDAYSPDNPLIMNTGILTGSNIMLGLRTYFSAYSPIKHSNKGLPAAIWSAASGKFGNKFRWTGLDEVIFEQRSEDPVYIVFSEGANGPVVTIKPAAHLLGLNTHEKMMVLQQQYDDAHFASIGPAGEHYEDVLMGAIALSTEAQLLSGEDKCRFAGRGGMGSVMGSKNILAIVAQSRDKLPAMTDATRSVNRQLASAPGSKRYPAIKRGGIGGTWGNYEMLNAVRITPAYNFRPRKDGAMEGLFHDHVDRVADIINDGCYRCGIRCHHNIHTKDSAQGKGRFVARFEYEMMCLLGSNLGLFDGIQVAELIKLCDNLGIDGISIGATISYVLEYNQRHPDKPILNGATFGDFDKIRDLVIEVGHGRCRAIGVGVRRLSLTLGETDYAIQVKSLELPAYLPETNPGYVWAIAGGHVSMGTAQAYFNDGNSSLDYWVEAITKNGIVHVGYDMTGLCKFSGLPGSHELVAEAIRAATGLDITQQDLEQAIRRAFFSGLALERKQGFTEADYTLPERVFKDPNPHVMLPNFVTREFFEQLKAAVWERINPEIEEMEKSLGLRS